MYIPSLVKQKAHNMPCGSKTLRPPYMLGIRSKLSFYVGILFIPYLKLTAQLAPGGDLLVLPLGPFFWGMRNCQEFQDSRLGGSNKLRFTDPKSRIDIWVVHGGSKNRGTSKWMVYNGTPYEMDDFRVPRFLETLHIDLDTMTQIFRFRSLLWMRI